jgi:hypothetical protein
MKALLSRAGGMGDFGEIEDRLETAQIQVHALFERLLPA